MHQIASAGNTVVPVILTLERLGFEISFRRGDAGEWVRASREGEEYVAEDPVAVLGLVKLVEARGWNWRAEDSEIDRVLRQYGLE